MVIPSPLRVFSCLCLILLLAPTDAFHRLESIPLRSETLNDLITASIIGAVLGDIHERAKEQQEEDVNEASAQNHHPLFLPMPWHPPPPPPHPPMPRHPLHHHPMQHHHPLQHPMLPLMHPMPHFHHPPPPMPLMHPNMAQWIHPQMIAQLQQHFQHQHQMLSSHQPLHTLPSFDTVEVHHLWHPGIQQGSPVLRLNFGGQLLDHKILQTH